MFWRHVVVPNQGNRQLSTIGARYNLSLIRDRSLSLSGYERNQLFQNVRSGDDRSFHELGALAGADTILDGRGVARGDIDDDGDLDLVISNRNYPHVTVLRNDHPAGKNHFLAVEPRGSRSNRMAVGARVTASCGESVQTRSVNLGEGFISQSDTRVWFGLGRCNGPAEVAIEWPSGKSERLGGIPLDRTIVVVEGEPGWRERLPGPRNPTLVPPPPVRRPAGGELPPLRVPAPAWSLPQASSAQAQSIEYDPANPSDALPRTLLVNFWATWCAPCTEEIADLVALFPRLALEGVGIVGISVDDASPSTVRYYARSMNVPYPIVHDRDGAVFRAHVELLELGSGSVPLSLLIHDGKIRRAFRGRVEPHEIVEALHAVRGSNVP